MDTYSPKYAASKALIIGIDKYSRIGPLAYAVSDARGIRDILVAKFGFSASEIRFLSDKDATRDGIMKAYLSFVGGNCEPDDRLLVFFAGHGFTQRGRKGEIGYLVPFDGNIDDLSTLIRWRELTENAELIRAKHVLFIMDACYGGLALMRSIPSGGVRFLGDMLQRYSRQVITAGKANEVVADSGGPIPDHSMFTGHLLEALGGKAKTGDSVLTANGVMAYVYEHVSKDPNSSQTPHFGFVDGDGDFIFETPTRAPSEAAGKTDEDVLIDVPVPSLPADEKSLEALSAELKELLADERSAIRLHDLVNREVRTFLGQTSTDIFTAHEDGWSPAGLAKRVQKYESVSARLQLIVSMLAYWGTDAHRPLIEKTLARMSDRLAPASGLEVWLALRWYPLMLLTYSGGIAALAGKKYKNLSAILLSKIPKLDQPSQLTFLTTAVGHACADTHEAFKAIPGQERKHVPRSEYLYKSLQPSLDDLLFIGREYEKLFDRFEILFALACADNLRGDNERVWGPPGRFGWKFKRGAYGDPYRELIAEANREKDEWPSITAGLFRASYARFSETATEYTKLIDGLPWF